jgi:hypothetical protein
MPGVSKQGTCWLIWAPGASTGGHPTVEVVESSWGLSCRQVRAAGRCVARGRAASDARVARLAVALARQQQLRHEQPWERFLFAAIIGLAAWLSIESLRSGSAVRPIVPLALTALLLRALWRAIRRNRTAPIAERVNALALERMGRPSLQRKPQRASPSAPTLTLQVLSLLAFNDLAYGGILVALDDHKASLWRVLTRGALFAVVMTVASFTVLREKLE